MSKFFPALASTDVLGYFDSEGIRKLMSVRRLFPTRISSRFLTSLTFDESPHYDVNDSCGDPLCAEIPPVADIEEVFVDCGAFHYVNQDSPKFPRGGFVTSRTALENYHRHHLSRGLECPYLLCSPDHIITPGHDDLEADNRTSFTLTSAESFYAMSEDLEGDVTPVGVVHGRSMEERSRMAQELLDIGYKYLAFGGLVPLARNPSEVLKQLIGHEVSSAMKIDPKSPLGIAKESGVKTHIFGLNSPDWYRWWKRMGIDSFDGSKLSQEGAANGMIWIENGLSMEEVPNDASALYRRLKIKNINRREIAKKGVLRRFEFSDDGEINPDNPAWEYLMSARCTSPKCSHGPEVHNCDPRVTGSIEHNMGRTLLNAWAFDSIMGKIDKICEEAKSSDDDNLVENWSPIEVE